MTVFLAFIFVIIIIKSPIFYMLSCQMEEP